MYRKRLWWAVVLLGLVACGDDGGGEGGSTAGGDAVAGRYFGDIAIQHNDASRSIFAAADLQIADSGDVAGSTLTTKSPTSPVGEVGAITGSVTTTGVSNAQADLSITLPTLGTFTAKGALTYATTTKALAGMLSARDAQGSIVGSTLIAVQQE